MRQTNAVWLLFILGTNWACQFEQHQKSQRRKNKESKSFIALLLEFSIWMWEEKLQLLTTSWPLLVPLLGFIGFVVVNGGIVLGTLRFILTSLHHNVMFLSFPYQTKAIKIIISLLFIQQCFLMPCFSVVPCSCQDL